MLPLEYVFFSVLATNAMLGTILLITWRSIERKPHTLYWALLFWVLVVNMLLNAARGFFPDRNVYWLIVNATSLVVQGLAVGGYRYRAGMRPFPCGLLGALMAVECVIAWFTFIQPHMGLRMAPTPLSGAAAALLCLHTLTAREGTLRPAEWGAVGLFVLYALAQVAYAGVALMQGAERDDYWLSIYSNMNFLMMPAINSGLGLFTVLLVADDLAVRMRRLATTDQLTGLANRRGFFEAGDRMIDLCRRQKNGVYLALVDIDHFKSINDRYGHQGGDSALRQFARLLMLKTRRSDIAARMGGEEFVLLFAARNAAEAAGTIERLRADIQQTAVITGQLRFHLTASFGLVDISAHGDNIFAAVNRADELLYRAKREGRNRVVHETASARPPAPSPIL